MKQRSSRVIAYVRVSSEEHAMSGLGLADQRATILRTAEARQMAAL
jgi:DNA invertase Pin-like site-specific DNA recombinase